MKENDKRAVELMLKKLNSPESGIDASSDHEAFLSLEKWYRQKGFLTENQIKYLTAIFERN